MIDSLTDSFIKKYFNITNENDDEYTVRCPICGDSQKHLNKGHMGINKKTGIYHCFRCNASGRIENLLKSMYLNEEESKQLKYKEIIEIDNRFSKVMKSSNQSIFIKDEQKIKEEYQSFINILSKTHNYILKNNKIKNIFFSYLIQRLKNNEFVDYLINKKFIYFYYNTKYNISIKGYKNILPKNQYHIFFDYHKLNNYYGNYSLQSRIIPIKNKIIDTKYIIYKHKDVSIMGKPLLSMNKHFSNNSNGVLYIVEGIFDSLNLMRLFWESKINLSGVFILSLLGKYLQDFYINLIKQMYYNNIINNIILMLDNDVKNNEIDILINKFILNEIKAENLFISKINLDVKDIGEIEEYKSLSKIQLINYYKYKLMNDKSLLLKKIFM